MRTIKFFAAALAIVAAVSCTKENESVNDHPNNEQEKVHMIFSASVDPETKTTLSDHVVQWTESDKIKLFKNAYYPEVVGDATIIGESISDDKTFASFEGEVIPSANYASAYPGDLWNTDYYATAFRIDFQGLAEQNAVKGAFDPDKHLMVATTLTNGNFQFRNVCALAKVTIGRTGVYSIKIDGKSQSGSSDSGSIGGVMGWKISDFVWTPISSSNVHTITLSNADGTPLENGATYFVVIPACVIRDFKVSICDQNGNTIGTKSKSSNFEVERNKIYDMGSFGIPTNYKIKTPDQPVQNAGNLEDGKLYMIFFSKSSDHTQEDTYCLKVNSDNGSVSKESFTNKSQSVSSQYVVKFVKNGDLSTFQSYGSYIQGRLRAPSYGDCYFTATRQFIGANGAYAETMIFANHWTGESTSRCDIDIWRSTDTSKTLWDNNGSLEWGTNRDSPRKFFFYEVEPAY